MKFPSLAVAGLVVLVANGFALLHAARNRAGQVGAEMTLTQRDLTRMPDVENSGVTLLLNFRDRPNYTPYGYHPDSEDWLDRAKLTSLGFDCSLDPSNESARDFYDRQVPRAVFVALELRTDGLIDVDAATKVDTLRSRYPDRHSVLILPATVRITLRNTYPNNRGTTRISGYIENTPRAIHVPRPFSAFLPPANPAATYRIHVTVGSLLDPWVTGVEPGATGTGLPR